MATTDKIERVSTGIPGLDKLMEGGIPKGNTIAVLGEPGTGKTIVGILFLEEGLKNGETCIYLSIDERTDRIVMQANIFGCFKDPKGVLKVFSARDIKYDLGLGKKPQGRMDQIKLAMEKIQKLKPDRVVVDPVNSLNSADGEGERTLTQFLVDKLNSIGSTNIVIGEAFESDYPDKVTPFIVDGLVLLKKQSVGSQETRSIVVSKMRLTKIDGSVHPLEFTKTGIKVA